MLKSISYVSIIKFLLVMVIIGSVLGIENSQDFGCIIGLHIFSIYNWLFLIISSALFFSALKSKNKRIITIICAVELGIWILKYFFFKGGYITGFGGIPNPVNVLYDFTALGVRLFLISTLVSKPKLKIVSALLISFVLVVIKIYLFALPLFTQVMWYLDEQKLHSQRIELIGTYKGEITQISTKLTDPIRLSIDSTHLEFLTDPPIKLKPEYLFSMVFPNFGSITNEKGSVYDLEIEKLHEDSLVFYLKNMQMEEYLVRLKIE